MAILTDEERDIDPYAVLGLEADATEAQIRKSYRQKSLKYHPDKSSHPDAPAMFQLISLAHGMLQNADKRKFVDTKLSQARAQAARRAEMDSKRKVQVDDLLRREEEAKRARGEAVQLKKAEAEEKALREEGRRLVEQRRDAMAKAAAEARRPPPVEKKDGPPPISDTDLTLKISLPLGSSLTQAQLETALGKYGAVDTVLLLPAATPKPGKKGTGPRAMVQFATGNWGGCWACHHDHAEGRGIEKGAKAKWAAGVEPAWVKWAEAQRASGTNGAANGAGATPTTSFSSAPDFGAKLSSAPDFAAPPQKSRRADDAAFESATLFAMRQRERERLAEQIRREEAEE